MATVTITLTADQVQSVLTQDGTVTALQDRVAQLQGQLSAANASVAALQAKIDAAKTALA